MPIEPGRPNTIAPAVQEHLPENSGLLGEVAQFFYDAAPRQVGIVAVAGAIGFLSGMVGRAYNTESKAGLNQYILLLAGTGIGKDAVSSGRDKLLHAAAVENPALLEFKGPGELVSSAGVIKWLEKKPCSYSIVGEFGIALQQMSSKSANQNLIGLRRTLMQMYSKSAHGNFFDPIAYSDKEKNTAAIPSPSLTIFGESVPESFYAAVDETMVKDGLMPRFMVFEYNGKRNYFNDASAEAYPNVALIEKVQNLGSYCHTLMQKSNVKVVPLNNEASEKMREYDHWTTDYINASGNNETVKELWNRTHLKAMKLASLAAVSRNYLNPLVTVEDVMWATVLVANQTHKLVAKFTNGQTGEIGGDEIKQQNEVLKIIINYIRYEYAYSSKYHGTSDMHEGKAITLAHIQQRAGGAACFKNDTKVGPTPAIKRAVAFLNDAGIIQKLELHETGAKYQSRAVIYQVHDARELFKEFERRGLELR